MYIHSMIALMILPTMHGIYVCVELSLFNHLSLFVRFDFSLVYVYTYGILPDGTELHV